MAELSIEWAESAVRALEEAAEYISKDSATYAAPLVVGRRNERNPLPTSLSEAVLFRNIGILRNERHSSAATA